MLGQKRGTFRLSRKITKLAFLIAKGCQFLFRQGIAIFDFAIPRQPLFSPGFLRHSGVWHQFVDNLASLA